MAEKGRNHDSCKTTARNAHNHDDSQLSQNRLALES